MSITSAMSGPIDRDDLEALPPAPTSVYRELSEHDEREMTTSELVEKTILKTTTVRHAVERLRSEGLVETRWGSEDARERVHQLADGGDDVE